MHGNNFHLNLFRFYNQDKDVHILENNLSRAFAICLRHEPLLLYAFLTELDVNGVIKSQLMSKDHENGLTIDLQQKVANLPAAEYVFPVAMAAEDLETYKFDNRDFTDVQQTDITIQLGNALIIIEAKRHDIDCIEQLHNQIAVYKNVYKDAIVQETKSYSWKRVLGLFEMVANLQLQMQQPATYANAFWEYVQTYRPHWAPLKALAHLPFSAEGSTPAFNAIMARLKQIQKQAFGNNIIEYADRIAMPIDAAWASEVITFPQKLEYDDQQFIAIYVWPGNTKGQGYSLFNLSQNWINTDKLQVGNSNYTLIIEPYIKFTHISGKFIFDMTFTDELKKYSTKIFTKSTFEELAGMWKRHQWPDLEKLLDELTESSWRDEYYQVWDEQFKDSGRSFVSLALGYEVRALMPYKEAQQLDRSENGWQPLASKFEETINAFINLVEGRNISNALSEAVKDVSSGIKKEA